MTSQKDLFNLHRPKIHVQTVELGPHRQRVFTLPKLEEEKKYTRGVWVTASLLLGFFVASTVINSFEDTFGFLEETFAKKDVIAFTQEPGDEVLLGSDDTVEEPDLSKEIKEGKYYNLTESLPPRTSGLSYLVADVDTGQVIIEKNTEMILPMASVSKLMTAVVAKESLDMHEPITVTRSSIDTYGTAGGLALGEQAVPAELLYPLPIESSNDVAEVLASGLGRSQFLKLMNSKAKSLKMLSTYYDDPSGLSQNNVSSAKDLLSLARYINTQMPELWDITRVREYAILAHRWQNGNNQLKKPSFIGGKNGFTDEALRTTVSLFDLPLTVKGKSQKEKKRIAVIVLKSNDRDGDISKLLRYVEINIGFEENEAVEEISAELNEAPSR